MTPETVDTTPAPAVGVPRLVRLTDEVRGMYCKFAAGEVVMHTLYDNGLARLERQPWRNSLTISNVYVTDERWLDYEVIEPNVEVRDRSGSGTPPQEQPSKLP